MVSCAALEKRLRRLESAVVRETGVNGLSLTDEWIAEVTDGDFRSVEIKPGGPDEPRQRDREPDWEFLVRLGEYSMAQES